ncbi:GrpB family protein [Thiotrichales bacterium 19S3-7]|nr:GrpB family protein [Thiotrichales bacterium 19S3-7]MCF6801373.1 GrpB family protein [Thiotrichales bacterium 19S3-11]
MSREDEKIRAVLLEPYRSHWQSDFAKEADNIKQILGDNCFAVEHIGSTAILGIKAKPIIDLMPIVSDLSKVDQLNEAFERLGYQAMGEYGIPQRRFYWKSKDKRTHHIHLFEQGNAEIQRHLAFRDYLNQNQDYADAYQLIKTKLANAFPYDIVNYVKGKSAFIEYIDYKTGNASQLQQQGLDDIEIVDYDPSWERLANLEIELIKAITQPLKLDFVRIEHIGSTAVVGLSSKPIIDIFIVIDTIEQGKLWVEALEKIGYIFWHDNPDKTHLRLFKGMPPFGKKRTHHIHIVAKDDPRWVHRVLFRDILRNNPEIKNEYEQLKLQLAQKFQEDREAYTNHKSEFIGMVLSALGFDKTIER